MTKLNNDDLNKYGNLEKIQQHQEQELTDQLVNIHHGLDELKTLNQEDSDDLDSLLAQATAMVEGMDKTVTTEDINAIEREIEPTEDQKNKIIANTPTWNPIQTIELADNWSDFEKNMTLYAQNQNINLTTDPLTDLLSPDERLKISKNIKEDYGYKKAHCDKYDYMLAVVSGTIAGFIDIFFVGAGNDGKKRGQIDERGQISKAADTGFNLVVLRYAKFDYRMRRTTGKGTKNFPTNEPQNIYEAVHYLEMQYKVPYDAQYGKRLNATLPNNFKMTASNHHLFSLAHYPDLIGLVFSILDQFSNTGTYFANGHLITATMQNNHFELKGNNLVAKIFCGFCNWIGHIMSDAVGSSGAVQKGNRGSGLPIPGTEIFQLLNFKLPQTDNLTISKLCTRVFEQGYDARHAAATAVPVIINELLTRLLWAFKQYFYHKTPFEQIIKPKNNPELNRMLLCSYGTFAGIDLGDAAIHGVKTGIKTGGNYAEILMESMSRLNITLYPRLVSRAVIKCRFMAV